MSNIKACLSSKSVEWATPQKIFDELNKEFNFTLDPCATHQNAKCKKYYTKEDDGLNKDWQNEIVFCNPPYGRNITNKWVEKCYNENKKNNTAIVVLVPSRTDTKWFHEFVYNKHEIRFIKGRLKFNDGKVTAPFPSMLIIMK